MERYLGILVLREAFFILDSHSTSVSATFNSLHQTNSKVQAADRCFPYSLIRLSALD